MAIDIAGITGEKTKSKTEQDMFKLASLAMSRNREQRSDERMEQLKYTAHLSSTSTLMTGLLSQLDEYSNKEQFQEMRDYISNDDEDKYSLTNDELFMQSPQANAVIEAYGMMVDSKEQKADMMQAANDDITSLSESLDNLGQRRDVGYEAIGISESGEETRTQKGGDGIWNLGDLDILKQEVDKSLRDYAGVINKQQEEQLNALNTEIQNTSMASSRIREHDTNIKTGVMEYDDTKLTKTHQSVISMALRELDSGNPKGANDIMDKLDTQWAMEAYKSTDFSGLDYENAAFNNQAVLINDMGALITDQGKTGDLWDDEFNDIIKFASDFESLSTTKSTFAIMKAVSTKLMNGLHKSFIYGDSKSYNYKSYDRHGAIIEYISSYRNKDGSMNIGALYNDLDLYHGLDPKHAKGGPNSPLEHQTLAQVIQIYISTMSSINDYQIKAGFVKTDEQGHVNVEGDDDGSQNAKIDYNRKILGTMGNLWDKPSDKPSSDEVKKLADEKRSINIIERELFNYQSLDKDSSAYKSVKRVFEKEWHKLTDPVKMKYAAEILTEDELRLLDYDLWYKLYSRGTGVSWQHALGKDYNTEGMRKSAKRYPKIK